ncbi:type II secretion system F family protein [Azospirillum sp. ST 5-10]|uniref:type II secretion system F family protein n=1 Tax=unclassified Azospirillum TaxID=2630922 RepID=UPI003F4A71B4
MAAGDTLFRYTAATRDGELRHGERAAAGRDAVVRWLQEQGLVPLTVEAGAAPAAPARPGPPRRPLKPARHLALVRELATLLDAELPLEEALALVAGLSADAREKALVAGVLAALRGGRPLSAALADSGAFPADQVALVRAGEASGALAAVMGNLARALERAHALRERVRSALIYPTILAAAAIGSVVLLLTVVVPSFEPLFADTGRALPPATRLLLDLSAAVEAGALPALAALALAALGIARARRAPATAAALDGWALRLPLVGGLIGRIEAARFARTLGTLLGNGVALLPALELAATAVANRHLAAAVAAAAEHLRGGGRLGERLLATPGWPRLAGELVRVGEETGRLPAMLLRAADLLEEESGRTMDRLVALITPAVTLVLGGVVAGVVVALLSAVLAVNEVAL